MKSVSNRVPRVRTAVLALFLILPLAALPVTVVAQGTSTAGTDTTRGSLHTVVPGDTLWDLCGRYLNDPWLWPEIHRANREGIADPHWIYPGQKIWFPVGGGPPIILSFEEVWPDRETGLQVLQEQAEQIPVPESEPEPAAPEPEPASTEPETTEVAEAEPGQMVTQARVSGFRASERNYFPLASSSAVLAAGYIGDPRKWPEGQIIDGEGAEMNMSLYAQVFIDIGEDRAEPGDLFIVVDQGDVVRHPEWGQRLGRHIKVKGVIEIVDTENRTSQGVLVAVFDAVGRRDRVIPAPGVDTRPWKEFIPVQGGRTGFIVARAKPVGNQHPYDMLFIDGGNEEGLQIGDLYAVTRPQEERGRLRFYEQVLARAVVIAVGDQTATAMILYVADAQIDAGDSVQLIGRSVFTSAGSEPGGLPAP